MWNLWKKWKKVQALHKFEALAGRDVQPVLYEYNDLKLATRNFHNDNCIGEGGFSKVYKGVFEDGTMLAVEKPKDSSNSQGLGDFLNEVMLITGIRHRNLVQLKGCCIKAKQHILVYEYVENGNLGEALWDQPCPSNGGLNWENRFNICVGVARGLSYLHEGLEPSIIHGDIKPWNIRLDMDLNPKICDFGLAKSIPDGSSEDYTIAGTPGYIAPEYMSTGQCSTKVDVYSYGIVVFDVLSGRKAINSSDNSLSFEDKFLASWVKKKQNEGLLLEILQPELRENCVRSEVVRAMNVGLLCIQEDPTRRPSMSQVVNMLLGNMDTVQEHENDQSDWEDPSTEDDLDDLYSHLITEETMCDPVSMDTPTSRPSTSQVVNTVGSMDTVQEHENHQPDLEGPSTEDDMDDLYSDPITEETMCDPVSCSDGRTYCRWTLIDNLMTRSPYDRTKLTIYCDDITARSRLFRAIPEQESKFRQRRNKHREEALQHARTDPVELECAIEKLNDVLLWDRGDTECRNELARVLSLVCETFPEPSLLDTIPEVMHEDVIRARLDSEGALVLKFLVVFYIAIWTFII